jgi:serine/threonine protein kinase
VALVVKRVGDAGLVWTDAKIENMVVKGGRVKGIDLESAVKAGSNPVDYSPEACPPEFAVDFLKNGGETFVVKRSYDSWSLGMLFYNIYTGRGYFEGKTAGTITKSLAVPNFEPDFRGIDDDNLRDLCEKLCRHEPKKRIGITRALLHPYFTQSGIGKWSF